MGVYLKILGKPQFQSNFMVIQWDFMVIQWDFIGIQWDINGIYPLVMTYKKLLNMAQSKWWIYPLKMVMFNSYVNVYQRVSLCIICCSLTNCRHTHGGVTPMSTPHVAILPRKNSPVRVYRGGAAVGSWLRHVVVNCSPRRQKHGLCRKKNAILKGWCLTQV